MRMRRQLFQKNVNIRPPTKLVLKKSFIMTSDAPEELIQAKSELLEQIRINELLKSELKRGQKQLLTLMQDKYFLCERLLIHEDVPKGPGRPPSLKRQLEETRVKRKYRKRVKKDAQAEPDAGPSAVQFASGFDKTKKVPNPKRKPTSKKKRDLASPPPLHPLPEMPRLPSFDHRSAAVAFSTPISMTPPTHLMDEDEDELMIDDV